MKKLTLFAIVAFVAAIAISCCPCRKSSSTADFNLPSTSWQLTQLNSRSVAPMEDQYTIIFGEDDRVSGVASCNRITGSYTFSTESRTLKFDHMGMTRMMCPPGRDFEDEYGKMLGVVTHYEVDGNMLMMLSEGQTVSVFKRL